MGALMRVGVSHSAKRWSLGFPFALSVALILLLAACSPTSSSGTTSGDTSTTGTTASATTTTTTTTTTAASATATPAPAPPHALAWYQYDAANVPQIWASLNGATPAQITHVAPDHSDCVDQMAWSPPVFSPDLTHIVAALGSFNCGDGPLSGQLDIIAVSGGSVSAVPGSTNYIRLTEREAGWIDNNTVWFLGGGGLSTYALGASSATLVDPLTYPEEGVLRGTTFFWSNVTGGHVSGTSATAAVHRYNISTHAALAGTISLGTYPGTNGSPGDYHLPGWDASPDGSHVAYQVGALSGSGLTSQFFYANADGSGASRIASYATAHDLVKMQISPDGGLVAIANATPSPSVISASVHSPGNSGDPNLHFYTPDANSYPVWKWDHTTFWAGNTDYYLGGPGGSAGTIYHFDVGTTAGSAGISPGYNPWYTIGH